MTDLFQLVHFQHFLPAEYLSLRYAIEYLFAILIFNGTIFVYSLDIINIIAEL